MPAPVYILGGFQTDFARNWTKEGKHIAAMIRESVDGALAATEVSARDIEVGHVGNFAAELYAMQGHLGAFLVDVDPAVPETIVADEKRLRQILLNLLSNAVKFTERGEVVLGVSVVHSSAHHARLRFDVRATGVGSREEQLEKIFKF